MQLGSPTQASIRNRTISACHDGRAISRCSASATRKMREGICAAPRASSRRGKDRRRPSTRSTTSSRSHARAASRCALVLYPYHVHTLMLFQLTGLWPAYEDWKRELVRRVDAARGTMDVELWDFTGFSPYTAEQVPRPGDTRTELQWYWEAGHFKKSLGDLLLANMFEGRNNSQQWGRRLTGRNVDEQLREQRAARSEYENSHPNDVADLATLIEVASRR